jgi:uridine phosphorylase
VTPQQFLESYRQRHGLTEAQAALPAIMVATFQAGPYRQMLDRTKAQQLEGPHSGAGTAGDRAIGSLDGVPVLVVCITIGAPAAALLLEESIVRGVRVILVVGSAGSLQESLPLGSTVIVEAAEREDGTSHHYLPAGEVVAADPELSDLLETRARALGANPARGSSWTIDAPYRETVGAIKRHRDAGVLVVEMEAAAIFAVAKVRRVRAGVIVAVSDLLSDVWKPGFRSASYLDALTRATDVVMDVAAGIGRNNFDVQQQERV